MSLPHLNFPAYEFRLRENDKLPGIFDEIRKKWLVLTPEEWVRQHLIKWLVQEKKYPASLLAIEKSVTVNGLTKRCDVVAFNRDGNPILIVECKAHDVELTQAVFDQAARYNMALNANLFLLSNGMKHFCCSIDHENSGYNFLSELPDYTG